MILRTLTLVRMALVSLATHRRRTLLLASAVVSVTAVSILLNGLGHGIHDTMIRTATTLATGHLNVGGFYKVTAGRATPAVAKSRQVLEAVRRAVPELTYTRQRSRGVARVISERDALQGGVVGLDLEQEPNLRQVLQIRSGKLDDLTTPNTVMLFQGQADRLGVKVDDVVTLLGETSRGATNTVDCRVAAVAADVGLFSRFAFFVSNRTARELYGWRDDVTGAIEIFVSPQSLGHLEVIATRLRAALAREGYRVREADGRGTSNKAQAVRREEWTGQQLDVTTWQDELSYFTWILRALQGITGLLTVVMLAIVGVGITNTMWIAVRERTREIGTLRAIGMRRRQVLAVFVLEGVLLGLLGTAAGGALAFGVAALLNAAAIPVPFSVEVFMLSRQVHIAVQASALVRSMLLITAVCALAALFPARRAARLRPVSAMSGLA
jgi:putative ABC transport system permease protein